LSEAQQELVSAWGVQGPKIYDTLANEYNPHDDLIVLRGFYAVRCIKNVQYGSDLDLSIEANRKTITENIKNGRTQGENNLFPFIRQHFKSWDSGAIHGINLVLNLDLDVNVLCVIPAYTGEVAKALHLFYIGNGNTRYYGIIIKTWRWWWIACEVNNILCS
jgi:hypothetical protein